MPTYLPIAMLQAARVLDFNNRAAALKDVSAFDEATASLRDEAMAPESTPEQPPAGGINPYGPQADIPWPSESPSSQYAAIRAALARQPGQQDQVVQPEPEPLAQFDQAAAAASADEQANRAQHQQEMALQEQQNQDAQDNAARQAGDTADAGVAALAQPLPDEQGGATSGGGAPGDLEAHARSEAARLHIDPDTAVRVANTEGGFGDPVRQSQYIKPDGTPEQSFGPYQLNVEGGLGADALAAGIDPRNPAHARQAITFALEHAARNGWGAFHGAAAAGIGEREGIGVDSPSRRNLPEPPGPAVGVRPEAAPGGGSVGRDTGPPGGDAPSLSENQIKFGQSVGLSYADALAECGPVGLSAMLRAAGRTPTREEAQALAVKVGWTPNVGMAGGSQSLVRAMDQMGVPSQVKPLDWNEVAATVQSGKPVLVNSHGEGGHFWVVQGVRSGANGQEFDFGESAASALKRSGGRRWLTPAETTQMGVGTPDEAIYLGSSAGSN